MARRVDREGPVHRAIATYLRAVLPVGSILHHSQNEINRSGKSFAIEIAKAKAKGMQPGFPDLIIIDGGALYCIEVKPEGGSLSKSQRQVRDKLAAQGVPYAVCRSVQDARETLAEWGVKTREVAK